MTRILVVPQHEPESRFTACRGTEGELDRPQRLRSIRTSATTPTGSAIRSPAGPKPERPKGPSSWPGDGRSDEEEVRQAGPALRSSRQGVTRCVASLGPVAEQFDPFPGLKPIGYWRGPDHPGLADPLGSIDESWDTQERDRIAEILATAATHQPGEGCSICRICGTPNGFLDLSDGTFVWPEGLAHYVTKHSVRLPIDVIQHLLAKATDVDSRPPDVHVVEKIPQTPTPSSSRHF